MGSCETKPRAVTLEELLEVPVGQRKVVQGCCPHTANSFAKCYEKGLRWPDNGEFEWGGVGHNCTMCSEVKHYGCECKKGIVGGKPTIKRIAYRGDATNCCLTGNKTVDGKTCDPKYAALGGPGCRDVMLNYCKSGDKLFTDQKCIDWVRASPENKTKAFATMQSLANNTANYNKTWAQKWCMENHGQCDAMMTTFCNKYPNHEYCRCINSRSNKINGQTFNPACVDDLCIKSNAYRTKAMPTSCSITTLECTQYNTLINTGVSVASGLKPSQSCNINTTAPNAPTAPSAPSDVKVENSKQVAGPPQFDNSEEGRAQQKAVDEALATANANSAYMKKIMIILFIVLVIAGVLLAWGFGVFDSEEDNSIIGGFF